jgi:hypothetical protein
MEITAWHRVRRIGALTAAIGSVTAGGAHALDFKPRAFGSLAVIACDLLLGLVVGVGLLAATPRGHRSVVLRDRRDLRPAAAGLVGGWVALAVVIAQAHIPGHPITSRPIGLGVSALIALGAYTVAREFPGRPTSVTRREIVEQTWFRRRLLIDAAAAGLTAGLLSVVLVGGLT